MEITVHTVCFNEERMLPHFLNHYGRIASRIFVHDNMSTDRTVEIALSHPKVTVASFDTGGALSELRLGGIRNNCWKNDRSDYSIVCDTDEFLFAPDISAFLAARSQFHVFRPVGFNMVADTFPSDYGRPITEQVKRGCPNEGFSKMVLFQPRVVAEMNFGPGSHLAAPVGRAPLQIYDAAKHRDDLKLLHYKYLGLDYRVKRQEMLSERLRGEEFERYQFGFHYRSSFAEQRKDQEDLERMSWQVIP